MHVPGPGAIASGMGRSGASGFNTPGTLAEGVSLARDKRPDRFGCECDGDHQAVDGRSWPPCEPDSAGDRRRPSRRVWENAAGEEVIEDYLTRAWTTARGLRSAPASSAMEQRAVLLDGGIASSITSQRLGCDRERACTDLAAWLRAKARTGFGGRSRNVPSAASDGCQASASSPWRAEWGPSAIALLARLPFLAADRARAPGTS